MTGIGRDFLARPKRGLVIGSFMPPHAGHVYLCDFARGYVSELTIVVWSQLDDPILGERRLEWMRALFPQARILHCEDDLPALPKDDPERFWTLWADMAKRLHPEPVDIFFAAEPYGLRMANEIGARFVPVDEARTAFPITATQIRSDPYINWRFLPEPVRPFYLKRVTLFGAESTGKTTLAAQLARHFDTIVAPEYGRFHTETFGAAAATPEDMRQIVMGHLAGVAAASTRANRVLIEDTDPVLTAIWSDILAGSRDPWFDAYQDYPDLYLFCDIDLPWVQDGVRYFGDPAARRRFHEACERELVRRGAPFVRISGPPEMRRAAAVSVVKKLLTP